MVHLSRYFPPVNKSRLIHIADIPSHWSRYSHGSWRKNVQARASDYILCRNETISLNGKLQLWADGKIFTNHHTCVQFDVATAAFCIASEICVTSMLFGPPQAALIDPNFAINFDCLTPLSILLANRRVEG